MAEQWDPYQMLDTYLYDYMMKRNMPQTAAIFAQEANVSRNHRVAIDIPEGFLTEWWSMFWDSYSPGALSNNREDMAESSSSAQKRMGQELQDIYPPDMKRQRVEQSPFGTDIGTMLGQPTTSMLAARYEEERRRVHPIDFRSNMQLLDIDRQAHLRPSASNASYPQMQVSNMPQQQEVRVDRHGIGMGISVPMDSTSLGAPGAIYPRPTLRNAGNNLGVSPMPLAGWPLTGPVSSGMGSQELNSNFLPPYQQHQFQTMTPYPPQLEEKLQASLMPTSSLQEGTRNLTNLKHPVIESREKDGRMMPPMTQTADKQVVVLTDKDTQQQHLQVDQQQQLHENTRQRLSMPNKSNAPGGESALGATDAEVDKQVDENVESYLSHNEDNADLMSNTFNMSQLSSLHCKKNEHKGFSFKEVGSIHPNTRKVLCCHFSSDGKFLASAGHEKKVLIWNLDLFQPAKTDEEHSHIITDVRFRPNSTLFATSSFDRTVKIWDATRSSKSLLKLVGHDEQVMSLDFHPRKSDLLCSCDSNDEIRLWNVNQSSCISIFKGASRQVRFQPQVGNLLAAASGSAISLIDVETNSVLHKLEGHGKDVCSICWDTSGNYIASVSEDSARVWSVSGGKCIQELNSNGNKFESCAFHPGYSLLLVIGSYQSLVLWNSTENNKTITVDAHNGIIASLADSPRTEMIASASHDQWVKLWK